VNQTKPFARLNDKSRMKREFHVRFCESLWGKFLGATRPALCIKNIENALNAASTIEYILFLPVLGSTKFWKVSRIFLVISPSVSLIVSKSVGIFVIRLRWIIWLFYL